MASCSNSSNISSAINSFNIAQGSNGSRLMISISAAEHPGLTTGNVIRYDVPTSGYTAAKANTVPGSEVFGVVESYNASTQKYNVVMSGSITLNDSNLAFLTADPTGACGGNDIFFLSGTTAGLLQNLAPEEMDHVIKPVYQKAPHGTYTGTIVNYVGYKMGGNVQATLDTNTLFAQVGSAQFIFNNASYLLSGLEEENNRLKASTFSDNPNVIPFLLALNPTVPYDWKLEHVRIDDSHALLREIDFPEFTSKIGPTFNSGWLERIKIDNGQELSTAYAGRWVRQLNHPYYDDGFISSSWYGQCVAVDIVNRWVYIQRPAFRAPELSIDLANFLAKPDLPIQFYPISGGIQAGIDFSRTITSTNTSIQFVGYYTSMMNWTGQLTGNFELPYPFALQSLPDPYADPVNSPNLIAQYSKIFMKVKHRGLSVNVPQNISIKNVTAEAVTLTGPSPDVDVWTKLKELSDRITILEGGIPV